MRRIFFIALLILVPTVGNADFIPSYAAPLELDMTPQYPAPGDTVVVNVSNPSESAATVYAWTVNDKPALSGIGAKTLTLTAGKLGEETAISVVATDGGSESGSASATINPASVDVIWEADTALPPLYIGRPLPNGSSAITLLAIPHIVSGNSELAAGSLSYSWSLNGTPLGSASGYGKSSITLTPPLFSRPFNVSVHVENADGTLAAEGVTSITPQTPQILIYEHAPLLGVRLERRVSGVFPFGGDEISFSAFPLFFGNLSTLNYEWMLDGQPFAVDNTKPTEVTFRKTGSAAGQHAVTFSLANPSGFLEQATASFNLSF